MKLTFLGTGTSVGVPMIGCDCEVCTSDNHKNNRLRSSVYVQSGDVNIIIDTPPDFRMQALQHRIRRVDAVFITHAHADHIFGFDDIRRFNTIQGGIIPTYADAATMVDLQRVFHYVQKMPIKGMYRPQIEFITVDKEFEFGPLKIELVPIEHGPQSMFAYLISDESGSICYAPDCSFISEESIVRLQGIDVMILDALRHRPHPSHLTLEASIEYFTRIAAKQSYATHIAHDLDHEEIDQTLPDGINLAYDGLVVEV